MTTPTYQPGEIVRVGQTSPVVVGPEGPSVEITTPNGRLTVPLSAPSLAVGRVAPAQNPRPGEIWSTGDGHLWFATKYHADIDIPADMLGCNAQGWRVLLIPLDGGAYGNTPGTPEEIHQRRGLVRCVGRVSVCECQDTDPFQNVMHARSCPQWPTCDCPVDDQDVTHHLPDCAPGGEQR
ncbi:hypothetical protein E1287_07085 [Actinomadura sp. KC06]|uniref:hypothetical protein n=1 Tax=Actinomadura sp. KC06 TaxID=2530369 RepID=UPI001042D48B|nr:hypothetical protein [Actinomadura sp. KC06]TDD37817.1 hypothetical protein E1287_07085 [Actinomadura sp. KC06]